MFTYFSHIFTTSSGILGKSPRQDLEQPAEVGAQGISGPGGSQFRDPKMEGLGRYAFTHTHTQTLDMPEMGW